MSWREVLKIGELKEVESVRIGSHDYVLIRNILREKAIYSRSQSQTKDAFGFKWARRDTYDSTAILENHRKWMVERYLDGKPELLDQWIADGATVLDAGCGSSYSGLLFFERHLNRIDYLGVDISESIDVAVERFRAAAKKGEFLQADIMHLPFSGPTFDMIFSEGVLHHTDSTREALTHVAGFLKPGGRFLFYVYRKKGPIREFSDDYIRNAISELDDPSAWEALFPLTKLGKALGDLNVKVNVTESIPYLNIPAGEIDIQRLFYWHICKAFYKPDWTLDELNNFNFDWYRPQNCHRHTPEEIRAWCGDAGLTIERFNEQESGMTVVAIKSMGSSS
jgi:ubiquinone/menaquinone biosynthesis C-methylase UbiE